MVAGPSEGNVVATVWSPDIEPEELADQIAAAHGDSPLWLDRFAAELDRRRGIGELRRVLEVWGLNQSDAARMFSVSRQAIAKWAAGGPPPERAATLADLAAATDLLVRYLRRERVPAVVRRPVDAAGGRSLLQVATSAPAEALEQCRAMFDFTRVQA